jgi:hypothetical protein
VSPAALYFASGESLYLGAGLLLAACVVPRRWSLLRSASSWLGLILMIVACPPVSWLTYAILGSAFLFWLFIPANRKSSSFAATAALIAVVLFISGSEWSHRTLPTIHAPHDRHLVILGDSLSAGLGEATPWPTILERTTGFPLKNLARAGAGVRDALAMASQITPQDHLGPAGNRRERSARGSAFPRICIRAGSAADESLRPRTHGGDFRVAADSVKDRIRAGAAATRGEISRFPDPKTFSGGRSRTAVHIGRAASF